MGEGWGLCFFINLANFYPIHLLFLKFGKEACPATEVSLGNHRNNLVRKSLGSSIFPISDLIASIVPPGLFFGRIANFINGELYGKQTQVAWGVLFPSAPDFSYNVARHPSQLYAAVLEGLIPFIFVQYRFWKTDVTDKIPGRLAGEFLILYSCTRILNEIFREPDAPLIIGFSRGQFYSFFSDTRGYCSESGLVRRTR